MANPNPKRNLKNLRPWKPGESGNPSGRPKKRPVTDRYWELSEESVPPKILEKINRTLGMKLPKATTWGRVWAIRQAAQAAGLKIDTGATRAAREIREAIEGKAPQRIEISGPEKTVATLSLVFDRKKAKSFEEST